MSAPPPAAHLEDMDTTPPTSSVNAPPALDDDFEHSFLSREFDRVVQLIADDLHELADRVSRVKSPSPHRDNPGFSTGAGDVLSMVMNAMPNLRLNQLQHTAAEADRALLDRRLERLRAEGANREQ